MYDCGCELNEDGQYGRKTQPNVHEELNGKFGTCIK